MKTINIIAISFILFLFFNANASGQEKKLKTKPYTADQTVKAIDKIVQLSDSQKNILKTETLAIIEKLKIEQTKTIKDRSYTSIYTVLDSLLTNEQKEIMKNSRIKRSNKAVKNYKSKDKTKDKTQDKSNNNSAN